MFFGVCACAFLPLFVHRLFSKRISKLAAEVSLSVGTISWFIWMLFVYTKDSAVIGLCKALSGSDTLASKPWSIIDPLVIALPLSIAALVIVWLIDQRAKGLTAGTDTA